MLADLPAKRHRVMVNPVNMLSRPRRKIEQRTKLILKKRPSEDHVNRRRIRKETKDVKQGESATAGESSKEKNLKHELDDEDNKPLRPKLKRIINTRKFQHNSVNRKTIMKRAKRRSIRVEQKKSSENTDSPAVTGVVEIPTMDTPQRIDVNREPYNTREQANRGGSSRREEQRPGCSGSNGNANNFCAPAQNLPPLKHSIARLTANYETHDKSVQFHHSFLVQQECNNTDQHLPSGHHTLFENEAVVTKLDKPPLYTTKGSLDLYALQKNKLNKPRKGLNDCIAMLKNKLVEPEPHRGAPTSHISVQCGSDEPIDVELPPLINKQVMDVSNSTFQAPVDSQSKSVQTNEEERFFNPKKQDKRSKSVSIQPTDETYNLSNSFRRRSTTHIEMPEIEKKSIKLNSNIEIIPLHSLSENVDDSAKTVEDPLPNHPHHGIQTVINIETNPVQIQSNDVCLQSEISPVKTGTVSYTSISWQKPLEIVPITNRTPDSYLHQEVPTTSKTLDPSVQVDLHTNKQPYSLCNAFSENMIPQIAPDARLECRQMPLVSYAERTIDIPIAIPPAHANSNVDGPLDLSSKIFTTCETAISHDLSMREGSCAVCNYDDHTYSTLDLSNKGIDSTNEVPELDTVVDLRVKSTALVTSFDTLDLSMNNDMEADSCDEEMDIENEPTDLSIRGRGNSMSIDLSTLSTQENNFDIVQDLSTRNTLRERESDSFSSQEDISPTDLSARSVQVLVGSQNAPNNYHNLTEATNLVVRSEQNSYEKYEKKSLFQPHLEIISNQSMEGSKNQDTLFDTNHSQVTHNSSPMVLNSAYNPNLKRQQYNNRSDVNDTALSFVEVATMKPIGKQVSQRQDTSVFSGHSRNEIINGSASNALSNTAIKSAANTIVRSMSGYFLPNSAATSSVEKFESTMPVYALANTCIAATKIEPSTSATLTSSLLSIAGTTIASTTPVYTLAGTTVTTPKHQISGAETELKNKSTNNEYASSNVSAICGSDASSRDSENIDKDLSEEEKTQLITDMFKSLTPDSAQKIFGLPDHIKLILAMMQPDLRNQLMNVLPQFLPIIDELTRPSKSNAPHTVTSDSSDIITSQIQHAVGLSNIICAASTSQQAFNIELNSSKLTNTIHMPDTSAATAFTVNESQAIDQNLRANETVKEESFTINSDTYLVDPASGVIASRPKDINRNCIIDLTEDDNEPTTVDLVKTVEKLPHVVCQDQPTHSVSKTVRQKSNDQTASLRAVRIKAPSERHRETQLTKRVSEEQKLEQDKIDTEDDVNVLLQTEKSLVSQQPEVTDEIQNKKKLLTNSKLAVRLTPIDLKLSSARIITEEQSPAAVKKDHGNLVPTQRCCLKSSEIHLSTTTETKQEIVYESSKTATIAKQSPKNWLSDACRPKKVLEENSFQEYMDISDTIVIENDTDRHELDDDDSDDDISLAIIVKKKQRDELVVKCHIKESYDKKHSHKLPSDKNKKEKKSKAHGSKKRKKSKNSKILQEAESVVSGTGPSKDEFDSDEIEENDNITDDNKNMKQKCKTPSPQLGAVDGQQGPPDIDKDKENYISSECTKTIVAPDVIPETLQTSDKSSKSAEVETVRPQSPLNETPVKTTNVKESIEAAKTSLVKLQKETNENPDNTKNLFTPSDLMKKSHSSINIVEENNMCENKTSDHTFATSTPEKSSIADCCLVELSKNEKHYDDTKSNAKERHAESEKSSSLQFEKDLNLLNGDKNKATCSKNIKDVNSFKMVDTSDSSAICDVDDEIVALPLRRSRRGKTVCVDSNLPVHEHLPTTVNPVEKTPLTKKQLIFSKLLLDEENHNKCPEVIIGNQITTTDKIDVVLNTEGTSNAIAIIEPLEKARSSKRRKTSPQKQKSKKKKSLDLRKLTQDEASANQTDHINQQAVDDNKVNMTTDTQLQDIVTGTEKVVESDHILSRKDSIKQSVKSPSKVNQEPDPVIDITDLTPSLICKVSCKKIDNNKHFSSAEKRKLVSATTNANSSPKPKKTKLNKIEDNEIIETKKSSRIDQETVFAKEVASYAASAARRTRSKSVIMKSLNSGSYDPYDIDLDDIPEKAEPFRKSFSICKEPKVKNTSKPCTIVSSEATEAEMSSKCITESSEESLVSCPATDNSERTDDANDQNDVLRKESTLNLETGVPTDVDDNNDSDDSSKSDVPLKRYVQEKEKRLDSCKKVSKNHTDGGSSIKRSKNNCNHKNKKNKTSVTAESSSSLARETEEQLRSEQFMESFGFFSERKPRKSNLLASKKISETFHIIANESDDVYFGLKERTSKKRLNESRKSKEGEGTETLTKTNTKRGRKKKSCTVTETSYCYICKKEFRRPDNYLRHQMTLLHISKLSEVELRVKTVPVLEEPNYLVPYKQQLDRLKELTRKLAKQKKNSKSKIILPTLEEILENVNETVREQQISRTNRSLSRDEALFIDCCELLKESHKNEPAPNPETLPVSADVTFVSVPHCSRSDTNDGDVDSITAKTILESEEVRNLENDLISGLKEAAEAANAAQSQMAMSYHQDTLQDSPSTAVGENPIIGDENPNISEEDGTRYDDQKTVPEDTTEEILSTNHKKYPEIKEKMYPDIEEIDMFEDKFDKIKRKCRSQAAAAKHAQPVVESSGG